MADRVRSSGRSSLPRDRPRGLERDRAARRVFLVALGISSALHLGVLSFDPSLRLGRDELRSRAARLQVVAPPAEPRPPSVEVPDVTVRIPPPARPVVAQTPAAEERQGPHFVPHDVPPSLINPQEVRDYLAAYYPPELRVTGIEGNVVLWLFVNESGQVTRLQVKDSSGSPAFDALATSAAQLMRFRPALSSDRTVGVWVAQPLTFRLLASTAAEEVASR